MRALRLAALLPLLALASGCATVAGTAAGPVTGPLHASEHSRGAPGWFMPFAYVLSVPLGVLMGFTTGVAADVGFVLSGGEYGAPGHPRFGDVFNPTAAEWGRYEPVEVLAEHGQPTRGDR
jgi:hypothetical protein